MKDQTKWTPGPWRIVQREEQHAFNGRRLTLEGKSGMIADFDWNSPKQNLANAMLCAKAPEMAKALKAVHSLYRTFRDVSKDEQQWTQLDDEAIELIESLLNSINGGDK